MSWPLIAAGVALGTWFVTRRNSMTSTMPAPPPFAPPKSRGVPFAQPTGLVWPTSPANRGVSYTTAAGKPVGSGLGMFAAVREGGKRHHAAVDLNTLVGWKVLSTEDGVVSHVDTSFQYVGLHAVIVKYPTVAIVYAEMMPLPGLKAGDHVRAGQVIGSIATNTSPQHTNMLHFETWEPPYAPLTYTPWVGAPPKGLLDPTLYLLTLAQKKS